MLNKISRFAVVPPHSLEIQFQDGTVGTHDFSAMIEAGGPVAAPLKSDEYFSRAFLEQGALAWPNGYDVCPDALRLTMEENGELRPSEAAE